MRKTLCTYGFICVVIGTLFAVLSLLKNNIPFGIGFAVMEIFGLLVMAYYWY